MPPKIKIAKDMILDAAYEIVRQNGEEKLTVRAIADKLQCSTQPILYQYASIQEIRNAVYEKADRYHSEYIMPERSVPMNPLLALGMNYVRFGYEEKNLFRFLFQSNQFSGQNLNDLIDAPECAAILQLMSGETGMAMEKAKEMFLSLFITAHGCASLLAGNAMAYEEEQIQKILRRSYLSVMDQEDRT